MARKPKVDIIVLQKMIEQGKTFTECAKHFGVTPAAITIARKKLILNNTAISVSGGAPIIYDKQLRTIDQLNKINQEANKILDLMMGVINGKKESLLELQETIGLKGRDPYETALKAMNEIRSQLKLQVDIYQMLFDVKAAQEFQEEVLTAIGEEEPGVRERIINRLNKKRALRGAIQQPGR